MIKSMTGFGRCEFADENRKFTVEIKSGKSPLSRCQYQDAEKAELLRECDPYAVKRVYGARKG